MARWMARHHSTEEARRVHEFHEQVAADQLRKTGAMDPGLVALCRRPELLPENARALAAWIALHRQRKHSMGEPCPLAMCDIEAWMRMAGVPEASRAALLSRVLAAELGWIEGYAEARKLEDQVSGQRPRP